MKQMIIALTMILSMPSHSFTYVNFNKAITGDDAIKGANRVSKGEKTLFGNGRVGDRLFETYSENDNIIDAMKFVEGSWQSISYQCEGQSSIYPTIYSIQRLDIKSGVVVNTVSNLNCITQEEIEIDFDNEQNGLLSYNQSSERVISKHCIKQSKKENTVNGEFQLLVHSSDPNHLAIRMKDVNCHGEDSVLFYFKRL